MSRIYSLIRIAQEEGIIKAIKNVTNHVHRLITTVRIRLLQRKYGELMIHEIQGSKMKLDVSPEPMKAKLIFDGFIDEKTTERIRDKLIELQDEVTGKVYFFELGAHQGYYSLIAAKYLGSRGNIIAVEPDPNNIDRIRENVQLNNYDNVEILERAVGQSRSTSNFLLDKSYKNQLVNESNKNTVTVDVYRLDDLVEDYVCELDAPIVIRLDTEYAEQEVLAGAKKLIRSDRELYLFIEVHHNSNYIGSDIIPILESHGFQIQILDSDIEQHEAIAKAKKENKNLEVVAMRK